MSIIYDTSDEAATVIDRVMKKFHQGLIDGKAKIACLVAERVGSEGESIGGPTQKRDGFPIVGKLKISNLADRTAGMADATITLDKEMWGSLDKEEQFAAVDHLLESIDVMREDGKGEVLKDDQDRPRLKRRPVDYSIRGYKSVAERNKTASQEFKQFKPFFDAHGQGWLSWLPFSEVPAAGTKEQSAKKSLEKIADDQSKKTAEPTPASIFFGKIHTLIDVHVPDEEKGEAIARIASWITDTKYGGIARTRKYVEKAKAEQIEAWTAKLEGIGVEQMLNVLKSSAAEAA